MTIQLELPERARARTTDPITSHLAANSVTELTEKQDYLLRMFKAIKYPLTDEEMIEHYKELIPFGNDEAKLECAPLQSESGLRTRRSELVAKGKLIDSGERRKTKSGRNSIVWCLA